MCSGQNDIVMQIGSDNLEMWAIKRSVRIFAHPVFNWQQFFQTQCRVKSVKARDSAAPKNLHKKRLQLIYFLFVRTRQEGDEAGRWKQ